MGVALLALRYLQAVVRDLRAETSFGVPPSYFVVEQREPYSDEMSKPGRGLRRWRVGADTVIEIDKDAALPEQVCHGMYYDYGRADFSVNERGDAVRVGWHVGRRYGRGDEFPLEEDENGHLRFGQRRHLWVS